MRYIKEILQKNRSTVFIYIIIGILSSFMANFKAEYFQKIIDGLTDETLILRSIIIYGSILVINYVINYLDEYPGKKLEHGIFLDFKLMALHKVSLIDYTEYQKIGTGRLAQKIENGAEAGKNVLFDFWFCLIRQLIPTILFSIYFIWKINKNVTYALLIGYAIIFIITNILLKFLYQIKEKILINEEILNHFMIRGFMEMLVFRMERQFPNEIKKATAARNTIVSTKVKMNMIHEAFFTLFALLVSLLDICILFYAWKSQALTVGSVVALLSLIENAYTPIAIFNVLYVQYKLDRATFTRFQRFLQLKNDDHLQTGKILNKISGEICIRKLSFQYEGKKIFDELCLSIKKGEKVAFVGESGSGKSTLVKLLVGLLKYNMGQICLDGTDLNTICLNKLYEKISYFSQDSPVFDGTIKENLVFHRDDVPDSQLLEALHQVHLSHLMESSDGGLYTEIGERGTCLSGGEKQRLALARLWFKNPEIVILDEATSAMDNLTEEAIMQEIVQKLKNQTVIAVTHRLNSITNFDKIVVFRKGKIVGQGSFDKLISNNSYFAELYNASI